MKLFALVLLTALQQQDPIDDLYQKLERNQDFQKLNLTSDKDYYFKDESVFFFGKILDEDQQNKQNVWAYSILFDNNKNIVNYSRHKVIDGYLNGSIKIPDSISSKNINLGAIIPGLDYFYSKPLSIIDGSKTDSPVNISDKLYFKLKSKYLIPGQKNELYLINPNGVKTQMKIANKDYEIEKKILVEIIPEIGKEYAIVTKSDSIDLPAVVKCPYFDTSQADNSFSFLFPPKIRESKGYFIAYAGQEIIWLSKLSDTDSKINIDLGNIQSNYISGYVINENNELLFRDIKFIGNKKEATHLLSNDTISISSKGNNIEDYSVAKAIDRTYLFNRNVNFSTQEIFELSLNEDLPNHNMYFGTLNEKELWVSFELDSKIEKILSSKEKLVDETDQLTIPKITYQIADFNIKNIEKLEINVIDLKGNLIDYELEEEFIHVNISDFKSEESEMLITAIYKGKPLRLIKDSSVELRFIQEIVSKQNIQNSLVYESSKTEFALYSDFSGEAKFLNEVIVSGNKEKPTFRGRGNLVTYEELPLTDYTVTAADFLNKVGLPQPNPITGVIYSTRRRFSTSGTSQGYSANYPLFLAIVGPEITIYSGSDFNNLKYYPAAWVYNMIKTNSDPESVFVFLRPGFRSVNSNVYHERIFSGNLSNSNAGVFVWNYFYGNSAKIELRNPINESEFDLSVYTPVKITE